MREIAIKRCPPVASDDLNSLFASSWKGHQRRDFGAVLRRSLVYFTAHHNGRLIGFVNVAWDGGSVIIGACGSRTKNQPAFDVAGFLEDAGFRVAGGVSVGNVPEARFAWLTAHASSGPDAA